MSFNSLFGLGSHSPDSSLEGAWPLQESSGTSVADYSGSGRAGTISGFLSSDPRTGTGPNSYLPSAFDFDGDDSVSTIGYAGVSGTSAKSYCAWFNTTDSGDSSILGNDGNGSTGGLVRFTSENGVIYYRVGGGLETWGAGYNDGNWHFVALTQEANVTNFDQVTVYADGGSLGAGSGARTINTNAAGNFAIGNSYSSSMMTGLIAGVLEFSRELDASEVDEIYDGPEPINTAAPTVSGDTTQGSTLTCSPGTWGLDAPFSSGSNGTITYSYQWTRDGVDISGATSSTYATQVADVGADVGCRVRATNDGGYDADADTNSSNTITVVSGSSFQPAWAINATAIAL